MLADELAALSPDRAIERLQGRSDSFDRLEELLDGAAKGVYEPATTALVVASVLAQPGARSGHGRLLPKLVRVLAGVAAGAANLDALRTALAALERQQEDLSGHDSEPVSARTLIDFNLAWANLEIAAEDFDAGHKRLLKALELAERSALEQGVVVANLNLGLLLAKNLQNFPAATEHFVHAANVLARFEPIEQRSNIGQALVAQMLHYAELLHYQMQQYALSTRLARSVVTLAPGEAAGWLLLANGLLFLEKHDGAVEAYRKLAELDPQERSSARANLAVALVQLGRGGEALEAVGESLRLRPGEIRPLLLRAQLLGQAGEVAAAAADYESVIDRIEAAPPVHDSNDPSATSQYREQWTIWLTAYDRLLELQQQAGDQAAIEATLKRLKATGDDALSAMGHRLSGNRARQSGRAAEARSEYEAALQAFPRDAEARAARADLAVEAGDIEHAIEDLSVLAGRDRSPQLAIEGLEAAARRFPDEPRIQRWLGFAHFELGAFESAESNLEAYLECVPGDREARRWFGLSLISIKPDQHDPSRDGPRCFRGLGELARATSDGDSEAREALLWAVDRLLLKLEFASFFLAGANELKTAVPEFSELLGVLDPALHGGRDYPLRTRTFEQSIALASSIGLPCFAAYLHCLLADIRLLTGQLELAWKDLHEAEKLQSLVFVPRSPDLRQDAARLANPALGDLTPEIEHLHIYNRSTEALRIVRLTIARAHAIAGDREAASDSLGEIAELLSYVDRIPATEATVIAQSLRDAGRSEDALAVIDRALSHLEPQRAGTERGSLLVTRATVLARDGKIADAFAVMREAAPLVDEARQWVVWINVAAYLDAAGEQQLALEVLDQFDIDSLARSDLDHFRFQALRASALEGAGRLEESRAAADEAITLLEELRGQLKDLELRASWSGQHEKIYALAVRVALRLGDFRAAFDRTEQARSRLLVDQMAIGRPIEDERGKGLAEELRVVEERHELLERLEGALASGNGRPEIVARLRSLDSDLDLVELDGTGTGLISKDKVEKASRRASTHLSHVREAVAQHRLETADRLFGSVVGYDECRKTLSAMGRVVLVELVAQAEGAIAFLLGGDRELMVQPVLQGVAVRDWAQTLTAGMLRGEQSSFLEAQSAPLRPLLDAIERTVEPEAVICIVPHGALHSVPFQVLRLGSGPLIERNPIVYAPSASVLTGVLGRPAPPSDRSVVVANTRGDLPHADDEARTVAGMLSVDPIARRMATRRNLLDALARSRNLRILHLACHGYFDAEDPLSSGVLTADETADAKPAVLSARDFLELDLSAELVALSACETGMSGVEPGDELMGLNRSLLAGGARSILGSLWKVQDLSTSILMRFFYQGWLNEGLTKAQALRAAQLRIMKLTVAEAEELTGSPAAGKARDVATMSSSGIDGGPDALPFAAPAHWAAFTLNGDWR